MDAIDPGVALAVAERPAVEIETPVLGTLGAPPAEPQNGFRSAVREFFHGAETPYRLALVRICLTLTIIIPTAYRWYYSREIFSTDGSGISLWSIYGSPLPWLEPSGTVAVAINSVLILALFTACVGWCTRVSLILATTGYTYLYMLDILSSLNKSTAIASHVLFFLCWSQCGAVWSIDSWLARRRLLRDGVPPESLPGSPCGPHWPRRMIQILLAVVYVSAGATKLQLRAYFTGEHLQTWMLSTIHTPNLLGGYVAMHPTFVIMGAYITILWELLFVFLVWKSGTRRVVLGLGIVFHILTCLTLGLFIFPMICLAAYPTFASDSEMDWVRRKLESAWRRLTASFGARGAGVSEIVPVLTPSWSQGVFAAVLVVTGVGGVALEHKLDRYGLRRPEGPYQFPEIDQQEVAELLAPTSRIVPEDKVLNFDVGSTLVAGCLIDRRTTFHQGETVRVQCGLIPPHESMWIQCNLHDSQNRVVDTVGLLVSCDMFRTHFFYNLGDCVTPGEYSLVLKIAGEEIMRRQISVLSRTTTCLAN